MVTGAISLLEVGRSALSDLLNAHAYPSPGMVLRLKKTLRIRIDTLLTTKSIYDVAQMHQRADRTHARPFVPASTA